MGRLIGNWLVVCAITYFVPGIHGQSIQKYSVASGSVQVGKVASTLSGTFGQTFIGFSGNDQARLALGFWTGDVAKNSSNKFVPRAFELLGVAPNPFRGSTEISFNLPAPHEVLVTVVANDGRVACTVRFPGAAIGFNRFSFSPGALPAGTYRYTVSDGLSSSVSVMTILK